MKTRILEPGEWFKLAGTELGQVSETLNPDQTIVVVVEDDGKIVGCWSFIRVIHLEGLWIDSAHQKRGVVLRHLLHEMRSIVPGFFGTNVAVTTALTDDVETLLRNYGGVKLPGVHYAVPVRSLEPCPQ